ncbi:MAG: hypothetical protein IKW45_03785 [Clostridia bacterium]|nr:hypothetical protein [Clostridia bacterium]
MSKDYNNLKVSMTSSVPFLLLKEFDEIAIHRGRTRSSMITELMRAVVDKQKNKVNNIF